MDWFVNLLVGLSVLFTIVPAILYFNGEEKQAVHILVGYWGGVATVAATTAIMMFAVKPVLNWGFNLVF